MQRNDANAAISKRDAEINMRRPELNKAVTGATEKLAYTQAEMHAQALESSNRAELVERQAERNAVRQQNESAAFKVAAQARLAESEQQF